MTRLEAIEILEKHHMWTGEPQELIEVRKENEALNMAISALSAYVVIDELEKASGKTIEQILACFASDDEYPAFKCDDCPLRLKGICEPTHPGITCYGLWLNYFKNNC
mgnify:CR=1 FL=1